ncbi:MAG: hypothetical protein ACRD1Y_05460 [Terriglobales bacterium]
MAALLAAPGLGMLVPTQRHPDVAAQVVTNVPDLMGNFLHDAHTSILMREHGIRRVCMRGTGVHRFPFPEVFGRNSHYPWISFRGGRQVMTLTSNRRVVAGNVEIILAEPFQSIAERHNSSNGSPSWDIPRTISHLLASLVKFCSNVETRTID